MEVISVGLDPHGQLDFANLLPTWWREVVG